MAKIESGTTLSFSGGEYSDKWTNGPFSVLVGFDQAEVAAAYLGQRVPEDEWDEPCENEFVSWMAANGYIEDVPKAYNWYLGGYDFEPVIT